MARFALNHLLKCLIFMLFWSAPVQAADLHVYAAASLKTAIDEINAAHEAVGVYAASPALARQIIEGAPADIFISADISWMDDLEARGLILPGSRRNILGNRLVLIAPAGSGLKLDIVPGVDLLKPLAAGRLAIGETTAVPAGRYAKAALQSLGIWEAVSPHLAEQINVRAALQLVARGEVRLGIVYASDAAAERSVDVIGVFPENTHPPITYPAAIVASSTNPAAADYLTFLGSKTAQEIFSRNGFVLIK